MMSNRTWDEWVADYSLSHQNPTNQRCHAIGIPTVVVGVLLLILSIFVNGLWPIALAVFSIGWLFQFTGHYFEKKPPEFFKDPRFLLVGTRWWWLKHVARPK